MQTETPQRPTYSIRDRLTVALLLFTLSSSGCGADSPTEVTADPPVLSTLTLTAPQSVIPGAGEGMALSADARDQNGRAMSAALTWSSSDAAVATVDATGQVTALREGTVTITATAQGKSAEVEIAVDTEVGYAYWLVDLGALCECELAPSAVGDDGTIYVPGRGSDLFAVAPDGTVAWTFQVPTGAYGAPLVGPDGTIYIGAFGGTLHAVHPDGTERWSTGLGDFLEAEMAMSESGVLYVANRGFRDGSIHALDPDGTLLWTHETGAMSVTAPSVAADGRIYVGAVKEDDGLIGGAIVALDSDGSVAWEYQQDDLGQMASAPAIGADGTVYFGTTGYTEGAAPKSDGALYAFEPNGTLKWRHETDGAIFWSAAASTDGTLYVVSGGNQFDIDPVGTVYAIQPDGSRSWSTGLEGCAGGSVTVGKDGSVFVPIAGCVFGGVGVLAAYSSAGALQWEFESHGEFKVLNGSLPLMADGTLYAVSQLTGYLYAVRSESMGLAESAWPKAGRDNRNSARQAK